MSKFKVGDLVTPISVKPYSDRIQRRLLGKTLVVYSFQDNGNSFLVFAGVIGDCGFFWHQDDLRLVSETQAEPEADPAPAPAAPDPTDPAPAQKPLRRGDLVVLNGKIGVVHYLEPDGEDRYWVAALTGNGSCVCWCAEDLTRIGSIRKKVKRLKAQMEGAK